MTLPALPAKAGQKTTFGQLVGSSLALVAARLTREARRPVLLVTADTPSALRLEQELGFLLADQDCPVLLFPDWETLPYDTFSPHQDLNSERLATLWRIRQRDHAHGADVVLVPATTALYRLAPPSFLAGYTFHFKVKQKLDEAKFKAQLTLAGYSHVSQVVSPGEFSVRGGLVVVGEVTLGGTIEPIHNAVTLAEQAVEKGAKALLLPVSCRRQLFDLSDEMATKLDIEFYQDGRDALLKALAE